MGLAQIFILALCVASVTMRRCYNEAEVEKKALKKLKNFSPPPNVTPSPGSSSGCPVETFSSLDSGSRNDPDRSVSPWKYETVRNPDFYPQTYSQAVCLCQGCIMVNGSGQATEDYSYNSVTLRSSWVFAKRVKCRKDGWYRLELMRQDVTVGCTCVKPSWSH